MEKKTDYFKPDTQLSNFIPVQRSILREDLTASAKLVYGLMVARTMLSQKEENRQEWTDKAENVFIQYPIPNLAEDARMGETTVKNALRELKRRGFTETRRTGFNRPNRIYVKYDGEDAAKGLKVGQISPVRTDDNGPAEGQEPHQLDGWNQAPIYTDIDKQKEDTANSLDRDQEPTKAPDPVKVQELVNSVARKLSANNH